LGVTAPADDLLADAEMTVLGRMPYSSNATFLVGIGDRQTDEDHDDSSENDDSDDDDSSGGRDLAETEAEWPMRAIYKPHKGERPLWDFPSGLFKREVAAYELAALLGWDVIPRTVLRDGPFGAGSVQLFVDADFSEHYFTLLESRPSVHASLRKMAAFDLLANNADRKGGHVLLRPIDDTVWGIDNGLCFHVEAKLRTVMWDFAGEKIPKALRPDLERVASLNPGELGPLDELLDEDEIMVLLTRARRVVERPFFPSPTSDYAYPWPMV
jgi:uncharacterized repeat protein (TIGR03843 family)